MGLPAYQERINGAISSFPKAPILSLKASNDNDPLGEFNRACRVYMTRVIQWRSEMVAKVDEFSRIISDAAAENEDFIPLLLATVEEAIDIVDKQIADAKTSPITGQEGEQVVARIAAAGGREIAKSFRKKVNEATDAYLGALHLIRNRLSSLIWDFDPDAKSGPSFDDADELLTFLKS